MSCSRTEYLLQEFFADNLTELAREEIEKHLGECDACSHELDALMVSHTSLQQWQEQRVPHWDRGLSLFQEEHRRNSSQARGWSIWQWLPTAASIAMLAVMLLNVTVMTGEQGFAINFGAASAVVETSQSALAAAQTQYQAELTTLLASVEELLETNNTRLMQAVMEQTQQSAAENFSQMYSYFEQQRLLDLQDMRVGYEQLVSSDYETIRSLQQLANFVSYEGNVR